MVTSRRLPEGTPSKRYRCISCSFPVDSLFIEYSKGNLTLTQCPRCREFADKYVEHDYVVLFIDIILIKPQVYRHLLFNRFGSASDSIDRSIVRLGILLVLFDVYLTWGRLEKQTTAAPLPFTSETLLQRHVVPQYLRFLLLCLVETVAFHLTIRGLARYMLGWTRPNMLSTALFISSSMKLLPILMVIWSYDVLAAARAVGWAVVVNNIEALTILLECGYLEAGALAFSGAAVRACVAWAVLRFSMVDGSGPVIVWPQDLRALGEGLLKTLEWVGVS
ncbi:Arv1-like protein [Saitoella complicata NRRL Y-17804]|uniref:Protein ARV n=1 Tax=Saitoella complicata (strain BCRC 22490 / CBS 7301 / JCM 7358 / NBRC 10748 / NRRL Y-17804) TaxID=698492 RepID=A0A0E9NLI0_SAICN|nr:Arv1-like protein [Saitoella complicata NRRL Y-17804]ODQ55448.1 Arv1-like protein [Saitoella complicata NRRL Y-17804]GAO50704.1 hypothetical protein G7K_4825-t1 [Saitoella complicata NRRL Y-17804]